MKSEALLYCKRLHSSLFFIAFQHGFYSIPSKSSKTGDFLTWPSINEDFNSALFQAVFPKKISYIISIKFKQNK